MGSQVLSPQSLEVNLCISTIESMEVGTYQFTQDPESEILSMTWMPLHDKTIWSGGLGLVLRVGSSKKLDLSLNTSTANIYA